MSMGARAGDWVRIRVTILPAGERAPGIPADTASHPYQGWIDGWAAHEAAIGERVTLRTLAGRTVEGTLADVNPGYAHSFGRPHPALLAVGPSLKKLLED